MKLYKLISGILIDHNDQYYRVAIDDWDKLINDDCVLQNLTGFVESGRAIKTDHLPVNEIAAPIGNQELWACGVTYLRSKIGRQEESQSSGGSDFYAKVYEAERPEVFFKATAHRVRGHLQPVNIRRDSSWDVPEPELTLMVTSSGKIVGYTIGNDMSSRSIEGENPLYLPQAKTYDGCAALGPCIYINDQPLNKETLITMNIKRHDQTVFEGSVAISQIKRTMEELVSYVYRACSFPYGALIMTGTGIVPGSDFTLHGGDEVSISIEPIGTLINAIK